MSTSSLSRPLGRRTRTAIGALAILASLALVAACAPEEGGGGPAPNPHQLHAHLTDDGFDLTWSPTGFGGANGYQLQVMAVSADPAADTWVDIPTASEAGVPLTEAHYTDVTNGTKYLFRVRDRAAEGTPESIFSPVVEAWYVTLTLPVMRIDTENHTPIVEKSLYLPATVELDPNGSSFDAYSGTAQVKGRGNSTWRQPKKPYAIKLDSKSKLMGMSSSKKWVLLANYLDRSQLRTYAAARISQATNLTWTPGYQWVEVVLNGTYMGLYQLAEKVDIGSKKVNIDEMSPDDNEGEAVTGGYLMEMDGHREAFGDPGWKTPRGVDIVVKDPEPWTEPQFQYIRNYVNSFEAALYSSNFKDPDVGYAKYLDVDSFVDYWITQEATRNHDSFWSSTYFSKARSTDKMVFGPIWDHDASMGQDMNFTREPTGWLTTVVRPWVQQIFKDPALAAKANAHWNAYLPAISQVPSEILAAAPALEPAKAADRLRWTYSEDPRDTPEFLANWLETRINWISTNLPVLAGAN